MTSFVRTAYHQQKMRELEEEIESLKEDAERWREFQRLTYEGKFLRVELPRAADRLETNAAMNQAIDAARDGEK